ncbi:putative G-protein coupled receptor 139 [Mustelus asterias]
MIYRIAFAFIIPDTYLAKIKERFIVFHRIHGFPKVIGAVDGTLIALKGPTDDTASFINQKGFHSSNVLPVSDAQMRILRLSAINSGNANDSFVLQLEDLYQLYRLYQFQVLYKLGGLYELQARGKDKFTQKMLETFYTIRKLFYMIIAVIGVPVNLLAIVILASGKCGLTACTTHYLVAMATADLLVIMSDAILYRISYYYFPGSFLDITPVCSVIYVLSRATTDCSVWFTITFSFDRFVAICYQKQKIKYCTKKTAAVVLATTGVLLCFKDIPFYFTVEPVRIINNVPWDCYIKSSYYTEPGWLGFKWVHRIFTPLLPFTLIMLFNALTVRHILLASQVRKRLRGQSKGDNRGDPEMESRRKSVILLFTISGSFILLWLLHVIEFLYSNFTGTEPTYYTDHLYIFEHVGIMLRNLSCCTNTFIYGATQSKFREQFKNAMNYPVKSVNKLIQNIN